MEKLISHYQQQWSKHTIKSTMVKAVIDDLSTRVQASHHYQADILLSDYRRHTEYRSLLYGTICSSLKDRKGCLAKRRKLGTYLTAKL